jgi:hypothetical protein
VTVIVRTCRACADDVPAEGSLLSLRNRFPPQAVVSV